MTSWAGLSLMPLLVVAAESSDGKPAVSPNSKEVAKEGTSALITRRDDAQDRGGRILCSQGALTPATSRWGF